MSEEAMEDNLSAMMVMSRHQQGAFYAEYEAKANALRRKRKEQCEKYSDALNQANLKVKELEQMINGEIEKRDQEIQKMTGQLLEANAKIARLEATIAGFKKNWVEDQKFFTDMGMSLSRKGAIPEITTATRNTNINPQKVRDASNAVKDEKDGSVKDVIPRASLSDAQIERPSAPYIKTEDICANAPGRFHRTMS